MKIFILLFNFYLLFTFCLSVHNINYIKKHKIRTIIDETYSYNYVNNMNFNLEHIVPKSCFKHKKIIGNDLHNIILYNKYINFRKSNYRYVNNAHIYKTSIVLDHCGNITGLYNNYTYNSNTSFLVNNKLRIVQPSDIYKGIISRSAMYMCSNYPELKDIIFNSIIDPNIILLWNKMYPTTCFEIYKNNIIYKYQNNYNKYILDDDLLEKDMNLIINNHNHIHLGDNNC